MAALLLLRRAFPSSLARPAASSSSSYVLGDRLFASRFLPFSSSSDGSQISPEISYLNIVEKLKKEFASSSVELRLPSGFPFDVSIWGNTASMVRTHETKEIVHIKVNGSGPMVQIDAQIATDKVELIAKMSAKPDELDIREIIAGDSNGNMGDYKQYLQTKGLTPQMISFLYQLLGFKESSS